jgi:hypothetical protein
MFFKGEIFWFLGAMEQENNGNENAHRNLIQLRKRIVAV